MFFLNWKKITSPANEFLLHKCRNNREMKKIIIKKKCTNPLNEFLLHAGILISTICGPKNNQN